ncbi:DUF1810 domain-containing protein [Pedobacter sp.]|uniref:DUF1810 domain-containing protein n=1 Tax=Pedobacter sp. TaxID=1411316 RepID=UPI003BA8B7F0
MSSEDIYRFLAPHNLTYQRAVEEIRHSKKQSHWMWYIFPQLEGLGKSDTAILYAIQDLKEAEAYYVHPVLGANLLEISNVLLRIEDKSANEIFGYPDNLKLHSCMTLFAQIEHVDRVFQLVLDKYFNGEPDQQTLKRLR